MIEISKEVFEKKKTESKVFSVISEFRGDEVTPIRIFKALDGKKKFIFESGERRNLEGRYSFIAENPYLEIVEDKAHSIEKLKKEVNKDFDLESNPLPFKGGAIGYFGYDTVGFYEKSIKITNVDKLGFPKVRFNFYRRYIAYDHLKNKVYIVDNILEEDNRDYEEVKNKQIEYFNSILNKKLESEEIYLVDNFLKEEKEVLEFHYDDSNEEFIKNIDIIIIMNSHDHIKENLEKVKDKILIDTKNICNTKKTYKL